MNKESKVFFLLLCIVCLFLSACTRRPGVGFVGLTDYKKLYTATLQGMEIVIPRLSREHYQQCINLVKKRGDGDLFAGSADIIYKPRPSKKLSCLNVPIQPSIGQTKVRTATFVVPYEVKNRKRNYLASCIFTLRNEKISVKLGPTAAYKNEPCFVNGQNIPTSRKLMKAYQKSASIIKSLEY